MSTKTQIENGRLVVTRVFAAPRSEVFEAWVVTSKIEKWWGCADTTHVESEVECQVGGKYYHLMTVHGEQSPHAGTITEFDPPALLAYDLLGPTPEQTMSVRVEFEEVAGGTQVTLTHANIPEQFTPYVPGGWTAAFEKLAQLLVQEQDAA